VSLSAIDGILLSILIRACLLFPDSYLPDGELQPAGKALRLVGCFLAVEVITTAPGAVDDFTLGILFVSLHRYHLLPSEFGKKIGGRFRLPNPLLH